MGQTRCWDYAHAPGLEVLNCLEDLRPGVHDKRTVPRNRLPDWHAAEHEHLPKGRWTGLRGCCLNHYRLAGAEDGHLSLAQRSLLLASEPLPAKCVGVGSEVARPGQGEARARRDRCVQVGDRRVSDTRALVTG